jgi:hypothetical protein
MMYENEKRCYILRNLSLLNLLIETRDLVFKMILIISRNDSKEFEHFLEKILNIGKYLI